MKLLIIYQLLFSLLACVLCIAVHGEWRQQRLVVCVCVFTVRVCWEGGWVAYKHTG